MTMIITFKEGHKLEIPGFTSVLSKRTTDKIAAFLIDCNSQIISVTWEN